MSEKNNDINIEIGSLFKDLLKYLPSKIVPAIAGILFLPIVTRLFSPSEYGNYVLVIVTISILSTIVGWVSMGVVRFYPAYEKKEEDKQFINISIRLFLHSILILSILFLISNVIFNYFIPHKIYKLLNIGIVVFLTLACFEFLLSFLRIKRLVNWYSGFFVWKSITSLLFGVLLVIFFHMGVEGLLWGIILSIFFSLPFLWKKAVGKIEFIRKKLNIKASKEIAKYSFPLVIGNLGAWILALSDRYILQIFRNAQEVGIYSISYQISDRSILLFTSLFAFAFNPLSVIIWEKEGEIQSQKFVSMGTRYFIILCVPAIVGISVLRESILKVLSTPDYYEGAKIIPFVVLGVFFLGLNQRFGSGLSFYKKTQFFMYSLVISCLVNIGLNLLFIPKYGYIAAAVTTLVSYGILLFLTAIFSRLFFSWRFPLKSLMNSICASIVMGMIVFFVYKRLNLSSIMNLIICTCLGVIIYFAMLYLLKEIREYEKRVTKRILKKFLFREHYESF